MCAFVMCVILGTAFFTIIDTYIRQKWGKLIMEIIVVIIIIFVVKCLAKGANQQQTQPNKPRTGNPQNYTYTKPQASRQQTAGTYTRPAEPKKQPENDILARATRNVLGQQEERRTESMAELKARLQEKYGTAGKEKKPAAEPAATPEKKPEPVKPEIKVHVPAKDCAEHLAEWNEPSGEDLMQEVWDLMIKGYDGELTFTRDFVAEGIEMLNQIQM